MENKKTFNINRRNFLKTTGIGMAGLSLVPSIVKGNPSDPLPSLILPNTIQSSWMDLKFGMFIYFGINTFYDNEWSDGTLDISKYNPTELNTDQWCRVAAQAGMKYIVLVTKHVDGFCNWLTKYTEYCVRNTPFKRDLVAELAMSAKKINLKLGLYYALWDRHEPCFINNEYEYTIFVKNQITELLTNYGEVVELWFDGFWKKQATGCSSPITDNAGEKIFGTEATKDRDENFINAWRNEGAYRLQMDHLYQYIKSLQPNCLVMNNSTTSYPGVPLHPVDIRSGEKYTSVKADRKEWNWLGKDIYLPLQIETTMSTKGDKLFPSGNWFWHEWDKSVASK